MAKLRLIMINEVGTFRDSCLFCSLGIYTFILVFGAH